VRGRRNCTVAFTNQVLEPAASPLRVLHLNSERGWRGGEQQVLLLAEGLQRAGVDTAIVARPGEQLARRAALAGVPVIGLTLRPWSPWSWLGLRRLLRAGDIVHAHASHAHAAASWALSASSIPLVATRRVDFPPKGLRKYRRCASNVAVSQAIAGILTVAGVPRVSVIPDGVDPARFASADRRRGRAALGLGEGALAVLDVAALEEHKDHRTLLEAWGRLAAARPDAHLFLAGDGSLRRELEARAAQLPRVRLLGFRDDLPDLLAAADVAVLTSCTEGLGSTLIDAMVTGLPVVATRAGGIPELVEDGVNGLLCPIRDAAAVATALATVLDDAALRQRFAAAGRISAQRFTAGRMVEAYRRLYATL